MAKITKTASIKSTGNLFRKGDKVTVTHDACTVHHWGAVTTVRRTFWAPAGGGQPAGWVCELDTPTGPGRYLKMWERLLSVPA